MSSLAAARADNFYYAPDFDPKKHKSLNKYNGQHPLRERAAKLDQGILVIRFEVPFNIWCDKCGEHIAKGERFNAEKKAIGNYHSTKILQFSMTHHCGCTICIQTDPKNAEYIVVEGARKKVETYSAKDAGVMELPDEAEKERRDKDPLYRLEYQQGAKAKALTGAARVAAIHDMADARAADPYALNRVLRAGLRADKRAAAAADAERRALGLHESVQLLPASEGDAIAAQTAFLTSSARAEAGAEAKRKRILEQDIFSNGSSSGTAGAGAPSAKSPAVGGPHKVALGLRSSSQAGVGSSAAAAAASAPVPASGGRQQHTAAAATVGGSGREQGDQDGAPPPAKRQAVSWAAVVATAAPSRLHVASTSSRPGSGQGTGAGAIATRADAGDATGGAAARGGAGGGGSASAGPGSEGPRAPGKGAASEGEGPATAVAAAAAPTAEAPTAAGQGQAERPGALSMASYAAVAARDAASAGPGPGSGGRLGAALAPGPGPRLGFGPGPSADAPRGITGDMGAGGGAKAAAGARAGATVASRPPPGAAALAAAAQVAVLRKLQAGRSGGSPQSAVGARPHSASGAALGVGVGAGTRGVKPQGAGRSIKDRAAQLLQRRSGTGGMAGFAAPR